MTKPDSRAGASRRGQRYRERSAELKAALEELVDEMVSDVETSASGSAATAELEEQNAVLRAHVEQLGADLEEALSQTAQGAETIASLRAENNDLREQLQLSRHAPPKSPAQAPASRPDVWPRQGPRSSKGSLPSSKGSPPGRRAERAPDVRASVSDAFVEWCRRGGGLVGKADHFKRRLSEAVPGAELHRVFRDSDSPTRPVRLSVVPGVSPVEYWAVVERGSAVVLPHPSGPRQFRELAPVFEGDATPSAVDEVQPAVARSVSDGFVIESTGAVR